METKIYTWNTGRLYGREGQRIAATVIEEKAKIVFADLDRHVDGEIPLSRRGKDWDAYAIEKLVMTAYDFGNYSHYAADGDYPAYRATVSQLHKYAAEHAPKLAALRAMGDRS